MIMIFLPVKNTASKVAVVGNLAKTNLFLVIIQGTPTDTVTPIEGITQEFKNVNKDTEVEHLGAVSENEKLFNVKSITLVLKNGKTRNVDISKAKMLVE